MTPGPQHQQQRQRVPDTVYVSFSAEINVSTSESLIATMAKYASVGVKNVYLLFSSPGGHVMAGLNLYNVLRGMPFNLITHNVGNVDSIGNAIFLAGDERFAAPHSRFMFHGVAQQIQGGQSVDRRRLRELLDSLEKDEARIASVISQRSSIEIGDAEQLFAEAQVKNPTDAVSLGIIHEIRDVEIPAGTPVEALVFKR